MATTAPLQLRILGPPEITWRGEPFTLPRRQVRALLYRLAVGMEPVARDALTLLLWPDTVEATARRNLSRLLSTLRRDLPHPDILQTTRATIRLNPALTWSDTATFTSLAEEGTFTHLEEAVTLVRGTFLSGFFLPNVREFNEWHSRRQHAFERRYLAALSTLVSDSRRRGNPDAAIKYAQRYLAMDELAEEIHRHLMELYAQMGKRSAALRQFERCVLILERELGVSPLPETRAAYEAVRDGTLQPERESMPEPRWSVLPGPDAPLVGRETALAALDAAHARFHSGGVIFITGAAGVGKTRLMQTFATSRNGFVLSGNSHAGETTIPYQPLVQALRQILPQRGLWQHTSHIWLAELSRLLPELRTHYPNLPAPLEIEPRQAQARLFEALRQVFCGLATAAPLLLCLDDVHRADESTREWLRYFAHRQADSRVCILATCRPPAQQALSGWQQALQRARLMTNIALDGLKPPAVAALLRQLEPVPAEADRWAARIYAATGGNAFFVLETIRAMTAAGSFRGDTDDLPLSVTVREAVLRRVADLQPLARQVLEVTAVLAPNATLATMAMTAGRDELETAAALDELAARQLIRPEGLLFHFQHELAREAMYQDISYWRRRLLHRRAADVLATTSRTADVATAAAIADHYEAAGEAEQALGYFQQAADLAQSLYANAEATGYFEKALAILEEASEGNERLKVQIRLYEGLGQVLRRQALYAKAERAYQSMQNGASTLGDFEALAQSWLRLGQVQDSLRRYADSLSSAARAEEVAAQHQLDDLLAYALYAKSWALFRLQELEEALSVALAAAELSTKVDNRNIMARTHNTLGAIYKYLGQYDVSERHQQTALELFQKLGDRRRVAGVLGNLGATARLRQDFMASRDLCRRAVKLALEIGERDWLAEFLDNLGFAQLQLRHFQDAIRSFSQAIEVAQSAGTPVHAHLYQHLGEAHVGRSQWPEAQDAGRKALALAQESQQRAAVAEAWYLLGRIGAATSAPVSIGVDRYDARACLARSFQFFTTLDDKPRATAVAQLLAQLE